MKAIPSEQAGEVRTPALGDLAERFRQHARRLTGPRETLLARLRQHRRPLTIKELHKLMTPGGCDLATVYRAMRLLEEASLVKRFDFGDGAARFQLVSERHQRTHHHHLICKRCSEIVELEACALPGLDSVVGEHHGFKQVEHRLEFFGLCPACQ